MENIDIIENIINSEIEKEDNDFSNDFLNDFLVEAKEYIENIEQDILELENDINNNEIINKIFRNMHSLKGLSGFVAQNNIEKIAHITENLLSKLRKRELISNSKIIDLILKSVDYVNKIIKNLKLNEDNVFLDEIHIHLQDIEEISENNMYANYLKIGEILENELKLNANDIEKILKMQKNKYKNLKFGEIALLENMVECFEVSEAIKKQLILFKKQNEVLKDTEIPKLGEILKENNILDDDDLKELMQKQSTEYKDKKIGEIAVKENKATIEDIAAAIKKQKEYKEKNIDDNETTNNFYVRLPINRVDDIVNMVGELMILNSQIMQDLTKINYQNAKIMRTEKIIKDLQMNIMKMRMVTLKTTFQKLKRIGRDCITELNKNADIEVYGAETEIDRDIAEKLLTPLTHIVKNSVSHGIEKREEREKKGKNEKGKIVIEAFSKRGNVYIRVIDDGKGIDTKEVYKKAMEKNLIDINKNYTDEEIVELIFLPGFSTKDNIDKISGRGVGMDVVKEEIKKIGGKIDIKNKQGEGMETTFKIPINLAALNGTVVKIGSNRFIIPTNYIKEIISERENINIELQGKKRFLRIREKIIEIVSNEEFIGIKGDKENIIIILEIEGKYRAMKVDDIIERKEIVVKQIGDEIGSVKFVAGASILGDGLVSLIIDIENIFKS